MALFRRRGVRSGRKSDRKATAEFLAEWVAVRRGVEVFVEPKTAVTDVSILLVAHDGEFTRRVIGSTEAARDFAREHALPIYDATVVGYPQRMRDFSRRHTIRQQRAERDALGDS
jgi:hypothetical protein